MNPPMDALELAEEARPAPVSVGSDGSQGLAPSGDWPFGSLRASRDDADPDAVEAAAGAEELHGLAASGESTGTVPSMPAPFRGHPVSAVRSEPCVRSLPPAVRRGSADTCSGTRNSRGRPWCGDCLPRRRRPWSRRGCISRTRRRTRPQRRPRARRPGSARSRRSRRRRRRRRRRRPRGTSNRRCPRHPGRCPRRRGEPHRAIGAPGLAGSAPALARGDRAEAAVSLSAGVRPGPVSEPTLHRPPAVSVPAAEPRVPASEPVVNPPESPPEPHVDDRAPAPEPDVESSGAGAGTRPRGASAGLRRRHRDQETDTRRPRRGFARTGLAGAPRRRRRFGHADVSRRARARARKP